MDYQPKPEARPSVTTTLLDRYNKASDIANVGGGSAKEAGPAAFRSTDFISQGDGEFKAQQGPAGIANDGRSVQIKDWNAHGGKDYLPTVKYAPSGRL